MTAPTVITRTYDLSLPPDERMILRYAGMRERHPRVDALLEKTLRDVRGRLVNRVCYCELPLHRDGNMLDLDFAKIESADLAKRLDGCDRIVLFAATVGGGLDRLIARYSVESPAQALLCQAIGTESVELLCNIFCEELAAEAASRGEATRARFSPGYGDLPLELQRDIFAMLDCPRRIGLSLSESLLMTPTKSVTAIVGIANGGARRPAE